MNKTLIKNWNNIVRDKDIVYFLGDFVLSKNKAKKAKELMELLNGEIIFIKGNHDKFGEKFTKINTNFISKTFLKNHMNKSSKLEAENLLQNL